MDLSADPDGNADDHGGHGDACEQRDAEGRAHERAQLPHELLLARPGLLAPEGASRRAQVVQVGDLLHAEPAELGAAHRARHVVARTVVHLHDQNVATRTHLK